MKNRKGIIKITRIIYEETPQIAVDVLADIGFLPYRVEFFALDELFELKGTSNKFDELQAGELIPEYVVSMNFGDEGFDSATVERVKP